MSDTQSVVVEVDEIDAALRRNIAVLLAVRRVKASSVYRYLGISRASWSARMAGITRFSAAEVITIAALLDVAVEQLAGSTAQLAEAQNWKKMNTPDLRLVQGSGHLTPPGGMGAGDQSATRSSRLHLVHT